MAEAPSNVIGAHLRNAYWLAVASRIATGHGDSISAGRLAARAQADLTAGAGRKFFDPSTWVSFTADSVSAIQAILLSGEEAARSAAPEIANVLSRLRHPAAIAQAQAAAPEGWLPDWIPLAGVGAYGLITALVAGGVLIWLTWPLWTQAGRWLLGVGKIEATRRLTVGR
jgi:hypothetical protein